MTLEELMTWNKTDRRWHKGYFGKRYAISPRQLGTAATKEASRASANAWWTKKQKEIDEQLGKAKEHPAHIVMIYEHAIKRHRVYAWWHRRHGNVEEAAKSEQAIGWLQEALKSDDPPFPLPEWDRDPAWEEKKGGGIALLAIWNARDFEYNQEQQQETTTPRENTIRAHIDDYLAFRRTKVATGANTLGTFDTFRSRLLIFRKWVDPFLPIESIDESLWERFYIYLVKQIEAGKMSTSTISSTLGVARQFIKNRYDKRLIDLPRNLNSRSFAVSPPLKEIEVLTVDEVKSLFGKALERERLYLLLMLNCGFYPVDIGTLKHSEYKDGRITRKRTKTRSRSDKVPTVSYRLWKEADTLLTKYRSNDPELVLLNRNGTPLWREGEKNGKYCRISNVKCNFFRLQKKSGITKSLKHLRKTASTMLGSHPQHGRYAEYFLGEAPRSVTDTHYVKPSQEQFDKAVKWLGEQLGFATAPSQKPSAAKTAGTRQSGRGGSPATQGRAQRKGNQAAKKTPSADTPDASIVG